MSSLSTLITTSTSPPLSSISDAASKITTTTTPYLEETLSSTPPLPSSSSSSSGSPSTLSSLFPGLQVADHFLPDDIDEDNYYDDFINDNNNDIIQPLSNLSSSSFPCIFFNETSTLSSSLPLPHCPNSADLTKIKIYSPDDLWAENEIYAIKLAPAMAFIALLMVIGILGNILVVYVYGFRFKSATQHFLIVCLACFDLVMCTVAMPAEIADIRFHHTFTSVFACKLLRFVTMFASISSSFTLVTVAYDRHRRITKPLSKQISMKQARIWMLSNMAAALCFSWPTLVLTGIRSSDTGIPGLTGTDCSFSERFKKTKYPLVYNAVLGLGFFTMITVIAVFYFRIWKTAKTRKINMAKRYTISSLSDQFINEIKIQRQISKDGMSDVLSKQLEKCVREKLQTKPSINCKDIYYFFENNSIRSTIGTGIAKKRGRYRGFSMSSSEDRSKKSDESCVLGQSFSYRTSVNCRRRFRDDELGSDEDDEREKKREDISRIRRYVGRKSSKLSKQSFSMAKIPENTPSSSSTSPYTLEKLQVHGMDSSKINSVPFGAKETSFHSVASDNGGRITNIDEMNTTLKARCNGSNTSYQNGQCHPPNANIPCQSSRSNSPFLQFDDNDDVTNLATSPSLSLKSANSPSTSPGRYRRNSSPLIGQGRHRIKTKVENSISIISDEFRPRPMSSLVDSVSQTLGRMHEFSDFGGHTTRVMSPETFVNEISPYITIHGSMNKTTEEHCDENEGDDTKDTKVNPKGCVEQNYDALCNSNHCKDMSGHGDDCDDDKHNIPNDTNLNIQQPGTDADNFITRIADKKQSSHVTERTVASDQPESFQSRDITSTNEEKEKVSAHQNSVNDMSSSFESFSHLIGPRSKPMEIPYSCDDVPDSKHGRPEDSKVIQNGVCDYDEFISLKNDEILSSREIFQTINNNNKICNDNISNLCNNSQNDDAYYYKFDKSKENIPIISSESGSIEDILNSCSNDFHQHQTPSTKPSLSHSYQSPVDANTSTHTLTNGVVKSTKSTDKTSSSSSLTTTVASASTPTTPPTAPPTTFDISDVETRNKPRSFSNSSLDGIASATPRRRNKNRCMCISQNLDKTTVVAFTVSSVFILSFLPFLILMFIRGLVKDFDYSLDGASLCIYHIFLRFYFLNSAINPFLYGLLNVTFRYECVRTWRKFAACCHGNDKTRHKKDPVIC